MVNIKHILIVASKNLYSDKVWMSVENGKTKVNGWSEKIKISKNEVDIQLKELQALGFCNYTKTYLGYEINITTTDI